jgi:hypothetical protein
LVRVFFIDFKSRNAKKDMIRKDIKHIIDLPDDGNQYLLTKGNLTLIKESLMNGGRITK